MKDKTILITGADGDIGRETTRALARMGAEIVMAVIDADAAAPLRDDFKRETGNLRIRCMQIDLASLESVRAFAGEAARRYEKIDVLINNAGVFCLNRQVTRDGFEMTMGVNYLGPFLLTRLLLPLLEKAPQGRILNVSSNAYKQAKLDLDDLQTAGGYSGMKAYSASKMAIVLFTRELAGRLRGTNVTVNALHPGHVASSIWDMWDQPSWYQRIFVKVFKSFLSSPRQGAETSIYLASSGEAAGVSGEYFEKKQPVAVSKKCRDPALQKKLWQASETLTGCA